MLPIVHLSFAIYASLLLANEISDLDGGIQLTCKLQDQSLEKKFSMHTYILYRYFVNNNKYTTVLTWIFCDIQDWILSTLNVLICTLHPFNLQINKFQHTRYCGSHIEDNMFQIWLMLPYLTDEQRMINTGDILQKQWTTS